MKLHHKVTGSPTETVLLKKLMFNCVAVGTRPKTVVAVVNNTGLNRSLPVLIIASRTEIVPSLNLLNVSINTILLFTTIPASAIVPTPDIVILKVEPVIRRPRKTPAVESITADSTTNTE